MEKSVMGNTTRDLIAGAGRERRQKQQEKEEGLEKMCLLGCAEQLMDEKHREIQVLRI